MAAHPDFVIPNSVSGLGPVLWPTGLLEEYPEGSDLQ